MRWKWGSAHRLFQNKPHPAANLCRRAGFHRKNIYFNMGSAMICFLNNIFYINFYSYKFNFCWVFIRWNVWLIWFCASQFWEYSTQNTYNTGILYSREYDNVQEVLEYIAQIGSIVSIWAPKSILLQTPSTVHISLQSVSIFSSYLVNKILG